MKGGEIDQNSEFGQNCWNWSRLGKIAQVRIYQMKLVKIGEIGENESKWAITQEIDKRWWNRSKLWIWSKLLKLVKIVEIYQNWWKLHRYGPVKWNWSKVMKFFKKGENGSEHMKLVKDGGIGPNLWKWSKLLKLVRIGENCTDPDLSSEIGQNWWNWSKWVKMGQNTLNWSKVVELSKIVKLVKIVEIGQDWGKLHRSIPVKWKWSKLMKFFKSGPISTILTYFNNYDQIHYFDQFHLLSSISCVMAHFHSFSPISPILTNFIW